MNAEQRLDICKRTRSLAAESFVAALKTTLANNTSVSEALLRDRWREQLQQHEEIFQEGWYVPPPHGMGVLFATDMDIDRINYKSLRAPEYWPQNDVILNKKSGIFYAFASPVNRKTGIIGDFGMTVYLGNKPSVIQHIQDCLRINKEIMRHVSVGMSFAELSEFSRTLFVQNNVFNEVTSVTDTAGINIGHIVPGSYEDWTGEEKAILMQASDNWEQACQLISKKRVFVSAKEKFCIQPSMAFTLEPRLTVVGNRKIPMSSFHTIIIVHTDGSKELLTNFSDVFRFAGMHYMEETI